MKIVLCNKYFFLNGGTEKYLFDLLCKLPAAGHAAVPFSVRYAGSWDSPYSDFFMPPPGSPDQAHFGDISFKTVSLLRLLDRSIYSFEAKRRMSALLDHIDGADIGYILNIYNYMSHSIIHTFRKRRIPVVMRLGDYHLLCPSYLFLRNGSVCTLCLAGNYTHGLRHRCLKGRASVSAVRVLSMFVQRMLGLFQLVDAFVTPCRFMRSMLLRAGFPPQRIHVITSPVAERNLPASTPKGSHILFFGRISYEKGLDNLIKAYQQLPYTVDLVLIGRSYDGERERLEKLILPARRNHIRFLGFMEGEELTRWIAGALFTVTPSRWYDNAPLSVYESLLLGVPVLASNIGGIPEQIEDGVSGKLFDPESVSDLLKGLIWMLSDTDRLSAMGRSGRESVARRCAMEAHMKELLALFETLRS